MGMRTEFSEEDMTEDIVDRVLPVEDVLDILRLILRVEPLDVLLQKVTDTIATGFNIKRVTLGVLDEKTGLFSPMALHGYPPEKELSIKRHAYTLERMRNDLRPEFKIGRTCYYVRAEDQVTAYDDDVDYIMNAELVDDPRKSSSDWHELDYIDFIMCDRLGNWTGWIEIDEPEGRKMPSKLVIDRIQVLTDLASIAIENAKAYEDAVIAMNDARGYLDLIVHDIGNMATPLVYYLTHLSATPNIDQTALDYANNATSVAMGMKNLVDNVRRFSEVRGSEFTSGESVDLKAVLEECITSVKRDFPSKKFDIKFECPDCVSPIMADKLLKDLFMNLLNNAAKYTLTQTVTIDIRVEEGYSAVSVRVEDRGRGIPDSRKGKIFSRLAPRPEGMSGSGLGLSIVALLVQRYNGIITVKDRVEGDCTQGTCFEVSFPKVVVSG